jgi:putative ABC transport system permease protein
VGSTASCRNDRCVNHPWRKSLAATPSNHIRAGSSVKRFMNKNSFRWLLVKRALLHKKAKVLLLILAVMMGSSVVTTLLNIHLDLRSRMNRELRDYGPNVILVPDPAKSKLIPNSALRILRDKRLGLIGYAPQLFVSAEIKNVPVVITGTNVNALKNLYPGWLYDTDSITPIDAIAGKKLAERMGLKKGALVEITAGWHRQDVRIGGTLESGEAQDDQLFVPIVIAQGLSGNIGFNTVLISALGDANDVEKRFSTLITPASGMSFQLIRKITTAEQIILDRISNLMSLVIGIIFVILFFCIHTTVSAILLGRQSEIALLRVLGARRKQIMRGLILELLVLALCGGLLGFVVGILMAQILGNILFQTFVQPHVLVFLITIFSSLAMMVFSSYFPIRRVINRQAAAVLKEA